METDYYKKYLKYKAKYNELKEALGGRRGRSSSPRRSYSPRRSSSPRRSYSPRRSSSPRHTSTLSPTYSPTISPFNRPINVIPIMSLPVVIKKKEEPTISYEDNIIFTDTASVIFFVKKGNTTIDKPMELTSGTNCYVSFNKVEDIKKKNKLEVRDGNKINRVYFADISYDFQSIKDEINSSDCEIKQISYTDIKSFFDGENKIENKNYTIGGITVSPLIVKILFKASRQTKRTRAVSPIFWPYIVITKESHEEKTTDNLLKQPQFILKPVITSANTSVTPPTARKIEFQL
jgi:hypothetical protein